MTLYTQATAEPSRKIAIVPRSTSTGAEATSNRWRGLKVP